MIRDALFEGVDRGSTHVPKDHAEAAKGQPPHRSFVSGWSHVARLSCLKHVGAAIRQIPTPVVVKLAGLAFD
jgi:hypothetical protein